MLTSPPASPFPDDRSRQHDPRPGTPGQHHSREDHPGRHASRHDSSRYQQVVDELRAAGCVFAEDEAELLLRNSASADDLATTIRRRVSGVPLEHILGWTEFCGLRIAVRPGVFVPRQRTALMVTEAVALGRARRRRLGPGTVILDLCCGAGAVGAAVGARLGSCEIYASDIDPVAVGCARQNLPDDAHTFTGDLFTALPSALHGSVDLLVANAPYVPTAALRLMPPEARLHEPVTALDGGADGLQILRRVITEAPRWLAAGGHLLIESSAEQAPLAADLLVRAGLLPGVVSADDLGATIVLGTAPVR